MVHDPYHLHSNGAAVCDILLESNVSAFATSTDLDHHLDHPLLRRQVMPASEVQMLDLQRVQLKLNHKGVVLSVNENASKSVFGFPPACLVGRPLATFINMFSEWRQMYGEDESLLVMLSQRAEQKQDVVIRVGVHNPMTDSEIINSSSRGHQGSGEPAASSQTVNSVLLKTLQQRRKERPAVMTLKMIQLNDDEEARAATAAGSQTMPVLALDLWRAEGLTSLVEVDSRLVITKAEPSAGLIFGMSNQQLLLTNFRECVI
jgi:hypothetical protein